MSTDENHWSSNMSEAKPRDRAALWRPVRESLRALADADPRFTRFGAAAHRYQPRPVLSERRVAELESSAGLRLPEDYRDFLLEVGDGGAGPYYGLAPLDQPSQLEVMRGVFSPRGIEPLEIIPESSGKVALGAGAAAAPSERAGSEPRGDGGGGLSPLLLPWHGVALLSHLGCGYLAYLVLEGPHRGQVWLDLGGNGEPRCIAPHFIAFYTDWLTALERTEWPPTHVKPGSCALALALSGYLAHIERQLGREAGALTDVEMSGALASLGPGSIRIAAETKSFPAIAAAGPTVDPCLACERMLLELATLGLARSAIAPGVALGFPSQQ